MTFVLPVVLGRDDTMKCMGRALTELGFLLTGYYCGAGRHRRGQEAARSTIRNVLSIGQSLPAKSQLLNFAVGTRITT